MKKVLLDTNAYSALMAGNTSIVRALERANQVLMSPVCLGELLVGFKLGTKASDNRALLAEFLKQPTVESISITAETAEYFAKVFTDLKQNGTPIPLNDVWIATQAMEHGAELLTLDKHFMVVPGLRLWNRDHF